MAGRRVRHRCEQTLRTLTLPRPFAIDAFCEQLAGDRGRPIRLVPMPGAHGTPCGMWLSTADADYVYHQVTTSKLYQEHIILHELSHMILNHAAIRGPVEDLTAQLLPSLHPNLVASMLARASYTSEQEQEAETLAHLIGITADRYPAERRRSDPTYARALDMFGPGS